LLKKFKTLVYKKEKIRKTSFKSIPLPTLTELRHPPRVEHRVENSTLDLKSFEKTKH
jgi:hypothetical protein